MVKLGSQASQRGDELPRSEAIGLLVWASSVSRSSLSLGIVVHGVVPGPPPPGLRHSFPPAAGTVEPGQFPVTAVPSCPARCAQLKRAFLPKVPPLSGGSQME